MTIVEQAEYLRNTIRDSIQVMYDELNHGQQQKLLKNEEIKALFDLYNVQY